MTRDTAKINQRVVIVSNRGYPTPPRMIGKTGKIADADGELISVRLDNEEGLYHALACEIEPATKTKEDK